MMALKSEDANPIESKADGLAKWLEMDLGGTKDLTPNEPLAQSEQKINPNE